MFSQKYKYIILSSVILGTIGLSVTSVNIEALDDKKEQENNTILNNNSSTNGVEVFLLIRSIQKVIIYRITQTVE